MKLDEKFKSIVDAEFVKRNRYTANLKYRSDAALLTDIKKLVSQERELLVDILKHLKEIDSRKLFLEIGYPSLWAYCTQELKYTEAAAQRRIEAMRAIREMPVLEQKLETGSLSLSNLARAQSTIRRAEKKSQEATKKILQNSSPVSPALVSDQPYALEPNQIVEVCASNQMAESSASSQLATPMPDKLNIILELENKSQREAEQILASHFADDVVVHKEKVRALGNNSVEIKLIASQSLLSKLEIVKSHLSHKQSNANLVQTIEMMADIIIAKKSQKQLRVHESAKNDHSSVTCSDQTQPPQRRWATSSKVVSGRSGQTEQNFRLSELRSQSRHVTNSIRRQVWQNADSVCEYTDLITGRRCRGQYKLEIEHVRPRAFGGGNEIENLRLYCRAHNVHSAIQATLN